MYLITKENVVTLLTPAKLSCCELKWWNPAYVVKKVTVVFFEEIVVFHFWNRVQKASLEEIFNDHFVLTSHFAGWHIDYGRKVISNWETFEHKVKEKN